MRGEWVPIPCHDSLSVRRWSWSTRCLWWDLLRQLKRYGGELDLDGMSAAEALEVATGAPADLCELAVAELTKTGTIRVEGGTLLAPKFDEHQLPNSTKRVREHRAKKRAKRSETDETLHGVSERSETDETPREEKRREEKTRSEENTHTSVQSPEGAWNALRARMTEMGHPTKPGARVSLPAGAPRDWPTIFRDWNGLRGVLDEVERWHAHLKAGRGDPSWWSGKVFTHQAFARLVADCDAWDRGDDGRKRSSHELAADMSAIGEIREY